MAENNMASSIIVSPYGIKLDSFPGGTRYINDHLRFASLSDAHKAGLAEYLDNYDLANLSRSVRAAPAFIITYNSVDFLRSAKSRDEKLSLAKHVHNFCLEYFGNKNFPSASFHFNGTAFDHHHVHHLDVNIAEADKISLPDGAWQSHETYLAYIYQHLSTSKMAPLVSDPKLS